MPLVSLTALPTITPQVAQAARDYATLNNGNGGQYSAEFAKSGRNRP